MFAAARSLKLRSSIVIPLESAVNDLGAHVDHVGHNRLTLGAVPGNVSRFSASVSVGGFMILVKHGGLTCLPLSVSIRKRRILWEDFGQVPEEEIWVIHK